MSQYSDKGKGKSHSLETDWSGWYLNPDGYWESMRTNASGATEYRTHPPLNQPRGNATMPGAAGVLDEQYTPLPHSESNQLSSLKATYAGSHTNADYSVSGENESSAGTYSGPYITADYSNLEQFSYTVGPVESHPNGSKQNEWECYPPTSRLSFASPKRIRREPGSQDHEALDPRYHVVPSNESKNFWRIGRVFVMLRTEPAGRTGGAIGNGSHITTVWLNKHTYSEIRRFVVVQDGHGSAVCLAIHTYAGRATLKPNVPNPKKHAIIYTGTQCPQEHSEVTSNGIVIYEELVLDPIRVNSEQKSPEGTLSPLSRVDFSKIYTVEKDIRVLNIGVVSKRLFQY